MKQIRSNTRRRRREDISIETSGAQMIVKVGLIGIAIVGATEGIIAYALLVALDAAEVLSISPRPGFMVSAGVAWRVLRSIDISMKA